MIVFDGNSQISDLVAIARQEETVALSPKTRQVIALAHERARRLSDRIPTYGRTTGVGANRFMEVRRDDAEHGLRLLRSHAVDAGEPLPAVAVRSMIAVRLAQLCVPGSGIRPDVLDGLVNMLNTDALPSVLEYGSIGTGDLAALAGTALTLMGERPASRPMTPMPAWGTDSAMPFMSSSALTIGRACLASFELRRLIDAGLVVFALSFVGLRGNRSPFSTSAAVASASPRVFEVSAALRELLGETGDAARIQDPYALRAYPVALAPLVDALAQFESLLTNLINTAQENPLFTSDDVVHHAAFHQAALGLKVDAVALALAQSTPLALSRIRMMSEPEYTRMEPFLSVGQEGASGVMMVEYVAAAAHGEIHAAAQPSSLMTVVLSRGAEEDASFAPVGVAQLERAVRALRVLLGSELLIAARLLRQRRVSGFEMPSPALQSAFAILADMSADDEDRDLRPDLEQAQRHLDALADVLPKLSAH